MWHFQRSSQHDEAAARTNGDLEAENASLRRKFHRADVERAERTKAFYSDVRSRLEDAEAELLAYKEKRENARAAAEKAAEEIALLREQLVKAEMQREEVKKRTLGRSTSDTDTSVCKVSVADPDSIFDAITPPTHATRYARRRRRSGLTKRQRSQTISTASWRASRGR